MSKPHPAKAIIVGRGLTQRVVAEAVGCNPHTFGRVLNGRVDAWPALRAKLAAYLGVAEPDLFTRPEVTEASVAAERAAQGLGATVTDRDALGAVSAAFRGGDAA